jgi:hypothetical protein
MRRSRLILPALAIVVLASPVRAWAAAASSTDSLPVALTVAPARVDAPIPEDVRARVEILRNQARTQFESGHAAQARRELLAAASLLRQAGALPTDELFTVATIALVEERPLVAAQAMDDLAASAEALGRPDVEARALLESAIQYAAADERGVARERFVLLRTLLASPGFPESVRAELQVRVGSQR